MDLLEVDAWVVIGGQTRLVRGKESAMLDVTVVQGTLASCRRLEGNV